jgi:protein SCO1/2
MRPRISVVYPMFTHRSLTVTAQFPSRLSRARRQAVNLAILTLTFIAAAAAQPYGRPAGLRSVGIDQRLNTQVPLDLAFKDESGRSVHLRDYFQGKPVVLSLVYYQCPMLCNMVMNGELRSMKQVPMDLGTDFEAVTVSFDPRETPQMAAAKKAGYIEKYNRPSGAAGWHFLTGADPEIRALADAVGFHYNWDDSTKQWAHASGIMILTPEGRLARYFYGIEYPKSDLRLGLVEASSGHIGSPVDQILLFCYHYDPSTGKYTMAVMNALKVGASITALALGFFMFVMLRRDFHKGEARI